MVSFLSPPECAEMWGGFYFWAKALTTAVDDMSCLRLQWSGFRRVRRCCCVGCVGHFWCLFFAKSDSYVYSSPELILPRKNDKVLYNKYVAFVIKKNRKKKPIEKTWS